MVTQEQNEGEKRKRSTDWSKKVKCIESVNGYLKHTQGCLHAVFNPVRNRKFMKGENLPMHGMRALRELCFCARRGREP